MKANNHKSIRRAYLKFIGYLICCITVCMIIYFSYNKASEVEAEQRISKIQDYDNR